MMDFTSLIRDIVRAELAKNESPYRIGRVASNDGRIHFDGESEPSLKRYSWLASYTPKTNDRVLLARTKGTYVILGRLQK